MNNAPGIPLRESVTEIMAGMPPVQWKRCGGGLLKKKGVAVIDKSLPAFPLAGEGSDGYGGTFKFTNEGMTLRDYFAGQALLHPNTHSHNEQVPNAEIVACWAYEIADAMLVRRAQKGASDDR